MGDDNPVRAIDVFVDELDLGGLGFGGVEPRATGRPAYHPATLLQAYIYGHLNRVQSSRRIALENVGRALASLSERAHDLAVLFDPPECKIGRLPAASGGRGLDDEQKNFTPRHVAPVAHRLLIFVPDEMLPKF